MTNLPHLRFIIFLAVLLAGIVAALPFLTLTVAVVTAFDVAAVVFLASVAPLLGTGTPAAMRASAARNDGNRVLLLAVSAVIVLVILVALGLVIEDKETLGPGHLILVIISMVLAWSLTNTLYALHYAHLYYDRTSDGTDHVGLNFPGTEFPEFSDFFYFSFVIGMTCQVSDVTITSPRLRRVVTVHGIFAFFFNLGVLALTINMLAGVL
jgi:uncharacterized membrane protein